MFVILKCQFHNKGLSKKYKIGDMAKMTLQWKKFRICQKKDKNDRYVRFSANTDIQLCLKAQA